MVRSGSKKSDAASSRLEDLEDRVNTIEDGLNFGLYKRVETLERKVKELEKSQSGPRFV